MFSDDPKPYNSFGNGAAMRVSAAGFAATDVWEAEQIAEAVTVVTHDHEEGVKGAKATAAAVALARRGALKSEIREHITRVYYPLDFRIDDIRDTYTFNETCQGTVPQAIECFLESASFGDAIRTAISLGGDSDTLAAITGAIAQAYYGVPDDIRKQALSYLDDYLRGILGEWERFAPPDAERFRVLTKYIGKIGRDYSLGDVYADARGAPGRAFGATSGNMDAIASEFAWELAQFSERHPEYALHRYDELLKSRGLKTPGTTAPSGDIGALDEQGVLALLMAVSGPDRIRDGTLTRHMENGAVAAWLKRLKDLG